MSWMTPRERVFSQGGPFIAKRAGGAGDITLVDGQVYTAEELADAGLTPRNVQMMYQAHHIDMAPEAAEEAQGELAAEGGPATPPGTENAPDGPETGAGGEVLPDGGAGAAAAGEAGAAPAGGEAATAPVDTVIVAYRHFGFGAYYAINAAGEKLGDKSAKATAEGFATAANVPLLGQAEPVPVKE